ncbi:MAG: hypothetical protein R2741_08115 [Methanolobus sp.]
MIAFTIALIISLYYSVKFLKFDMNLAFMLKSITASATMSLILIEVEPTGLVNLLGTIVACTVTYFLIMIILKAFNENELKMLKALIQ